MASWSTKRKLKIIGGIILLCLIIAILIYFIFIKEKPNCNDGIRNGNEEGIDCGGECSEVCAFRATSVNNLWSKAFLVEDGVYNIVALIENPNFDYNLKADYDIKAYNKKGVLVYQNNDKISLFPAEKRALFLPSIVVKGEQISKVFIKFNQINSLKKAEPEENIIKVISRTLSENFGQTKLTINLKNDSLYPLRKIEIVGILYDKNGNAIQAGKTFINYLNKREEKKVFMTWPGSISDKVNVIDIFTREL